MHTRDPKFNTFVEKLSKGELYEFAPPFDSYLTSGKDILDYCHDFFSDYLNVLKSFPAEAIADANSQMAEVINRYSPRKVIVHLNLIEETRQVGNMILQALNSYLAGFPSMAFDKMAAALNANDFHLANMLPQLVYDNMSLYRVRGKGDVHQTKDMFHVPFDERYKCASYRFSTLGYPALYLTTTVNTALLEIGIKPGSQYSVCRYDFKAKAKDCSSYAIVDLTLSKRSSILDEYCMLKFYPLIVACGLKVKEADRPFKPEYIIPQLLTQYIRMYSGGLIGISYNSTKYAKRDFTDYRQLNVTLFVPDANQAKGYSKDLADMLQVTDIINPVYTDDASIRKTQSELLDMSVKDITI